MTNPFSVFIAKADTAKLDVVQLADAVTEYDNALSELIILRSDVKKNIASDLLEEMITALVAAGIGFPSKIPDTAIAAYEGNEFAISYDPKPSKDSWITFIIEYTKPDNSIGLTHKIQVNPTDKVATTLFSKTGVKFGDEKLDGILKLTKDIQNVIAKLKPFEKEEKKLTFTGVTTDAPPTPTSKNKQIKIVKPLKGAPSKTFSNISSALAYVMEHMVSL